MIKSIVNCDYVKNVYNRNGLKEKLIKNLINKGLKLKNEEIEFQHINKEWFRDLLGVVYMNDCQKQVTTFEKVLNIIKDLGKNLKSKKIGIQKFRECIKGLDN